MNNFWIREANDSLINSDLRLEKVSQISQSLARNKDAVLREILEEVFGMAFNLEEVVDHVKCESYPEKEVYFIDNIAVAEFYKVEYDFDDETNIMTAKMNYRRLK